MTATFYRCAHRNVRRARDGHTLTRVGADTESIRAQIACEPSLQLRLDQTVDRLGREGIAVTVRLDEQDRVCVRFLCPCSTADEVRVLREFLAITADVRREVS